MSLLPDDHHYSYSQLSTFNECPYCFYLQKIEGIEEPMTNGFAQRGSLIHDLLDKWGKGELTKSEMLVEYERRYPEEVVTAFPRVLAAKGYAEKMYDQGIVFLEDFDEFEGYDILSTEEKFSLDLPMEDGSTREFVGIIDMMLRDQKTGDLIICDHKSKSKSGFKKAENDMYRQQLLYAAYVKKQYGDWPNQMMFHLFNCEGAKPQREFSEDQYNETLHWAQETIAKIESYDILDWMNYKDKSDFFCASLCDARQICPMGQPPEKARKDKDDYYERLED